MMWGRRRFKHPNDEHRSQESGTLNVCGAKYCQIRIDQIDQLVVAFTLHEQRQMNAEGGSMARETVFNNASLCLLCQGKQ
jgi:hypothetical protein